jgi:hypothetical protein
MPETNPSWDDVLANTPLNMGNILDAVRKALGLLPAGVGAEEIEATVAGNVAAAFTLENLNAAKASAAAAVVAFVNAGGVGPVEKSPTDLV